MEFNLVEATNLFKINYYKKSDNVYNSANVLEGRIKKKEDFTGKSRFVSTPMSFAGGVGSGSLPKSNVAKYEGAKITAKKVYGVTEVEREAIYAAKGEKGAFVEATKESVSKCVESYMRNCSRIQFGDGTGKLGQTTAANGVQTTVDAENVTSFIVTAASWNEANWEERDFVNLGSATVMLEIYAVNPDTRTIYIKGHHTVADFNNVSVYMQGSKDNDPEGFKSILHATSGSLYDIPVQRRWSAFQKDFGGKSISPDKMNTMMLGVERRCGKVPNMIMTSYTQMQKILDFLEDQKVYNLPARKKDLKGKISFRGVEFMSTRGPVGVFVDRFCDEDTMYFLNDNYIERHQRGKVKWFDDDGTVFLRKDGSDGYEARYGGYFQNYIVPTFHGVATGLSK